MKNECYILVHIISGILTYGQRVTGVEIFGGRTASKELSIPKAESFHHEYSSMACTIEFVDDVNAAIDHIHRYGRYNNTSS